MTCKACGCVADKYIEYDVLNIVLNLILHRESVYRHIIANRFAHIPVGPKGRFGKFAVSIIFFDAYTSWFVYSQRLAALRENLPRSPFALNLQLIFISAVALLAHLCGVWVVAMLCVEKVRGVGQPSLRSADLVKALLVSMYGKVGTVLMMVWDYQLNLRTTIQFFVYSSNVIAAKVFLGCDAYAAPIAAVLTGAACSLLTKTFLFQLTTPLVHLI